MIKFYLVVIACISAISAFAIPANPTPEKLRQPDGTYITLRLVGDEFSHYTTTDDGYTVVKSSSGYYVYAELSGGKLIPSDYIARDRAERTPADNLYLKRVAKSVKPELTVADADMQAAAKSMQASPLFPRKSGKFDTSKFRGLIILVEYNDCSFSRTDYFDIISDMVNKQNYDGYMTSALIPEKVECTGSVRDYYTDNSMGVFTPEFDIVGPVKINYSMYTASGSTNGIALAAAACRAADDQVDFAKYDSDGDGKADMVFFIFAGYGANTTGNNQDLLWPHASKMYGVRLDGVTLERYACSTEMYGREGSGVLDGIGTICHEFSHVLGLPDEYDTDYSSSGGQSVHPATWSVMAGGCYRNKSRTPVGYTLYERYALGFATPQLIEAPGSFSLKAINTSNAGYRINSSVPNEFFLIENRQQTRWDAYLLGHGMTVTRVDSTSVDVWTNNKINCNPSHNYLELLRATPQTKTSGTTVTVSDSAGDPFPGSGNVTQLTNATSPSLRSWTHASTPLEIKNIQEDAAGVITFSVDKADIYELVEDFETMDATTGSTTTTQGRFCTWKLDGGAMVTASADSYGKGAQVLALKKKSEVQTTTIDKKITSVSYMVYNPTSSVAIMRCYYSTNNGKTWVSMKNVDGVENITVAAGSSLQVIYNTEVENPCFKITETVGNSSAYCYVDDFTLNYESVNTAINANTLSDDNAANGFSLSDGRLTVAATDGTTVAVYAANGMLVARQKANGTTACVQLPAHGVYLVAVGRNRFKVVY